MAFTSSPAQQRFSLDDPEAGRKLLANFDARKVRLDFADLCWHFRAESYDDKMRLLALLAKLKEDGTLLEAAPRLYCRPSLRGGLSDEEKEPKPAPKKERSEKPRGRTWGPKDPERTAREAAQLMAFAAANGPSIRSAQFIEEGKRLGLEAKRIPYLLTHLRAKSKLRSNGYGTYTLVTDGAP